MGVVLKGQVPEVLVPHNHSTASLGTPDGLLRVLESSEKRPLKLHQIGPINRVVQIKDETLAFDTVMDNEVQEAIAVQNTAMLKLCEIMCSAEKKVSLPQAAAWLSKRCGGRAAITADNVRYWLNQYRVWRAAGKLEDFAKVKAAVRVEIAKLPGAADYVKRGKIPTPEEGKNLKIGPDLTLADVKPTIDYLRVQDGRKEYAPTEPVPLNPLKHMAGIEAELAGHEGKRWQAFKRVCGDPTLRKALHAISNKPDKLKAAGKVLKELEAKLDTLLERVRSARELLDATTRSIK